MPSVDDIAEETTLFDEICRRFHCVMLVACQHRLQWSRSAPGKKEVLHHLDGTENRKRLLDVLKYGSLHGQSELLAGQQWQNRVRRAQALAQRRDVNEALAHCV